MSNGYEVSFFGHHELGDFFQHLIYSVIKYKNCEMK